MRADDVIRQARELILEHGWNTTCYQVLNPGFKFWFSSAGDALVGYVEHHRTRIVGGAPVCRQERLPAVAEEFERDARDAGKRTCYFCAEARLESVYRSDPTHSMVLLGGQPVWDPRGWSDRIAHHASLRAQLHRARNKGVRIREWPEERARIHPALVRCLREWLDTRGLPPLHFLIEPDTLSRIYERRIFVAERQGSVIGFLVASPIPARNGWLVEQLVRGHGSVNGTSELLIDVTMNALLDDDVEYVSLGLAPLSRLVGHVHHRNPLWLRPVLGWMRAHGRRFYNFEGLEAFKAKFEPDHWDPVYAIVNTKQVRPRTLYAIAAAFAQGSPIGLIARAWGYAIGRELASARRQLGRLEWPEWARLPSGKDVVG